MKNPLPYPLVMIRWVDASGWSAWAEHQEVIAWADDDSEAFHVHEVGWLIKQTRRYIVLSPQIGKDGQCGNTMKIPRAWVQVKVILAAGKGA